MHQSLRSSLLASTATAAALIASGAWAQSPAPLQVAQAGTAAPAGAAESTLEQVVVTGSRLQNSTFTTPTPVTVQSAVQIQERAKVNIADALNEIPSFQPTQGPNQAQKNASSTQGGNTIDLRGLGAGRTLVLLDGRRFVPVSPGGAPDVSDIPTNLISRVEVVTGGASAQYGSDAVAGVVNFILNDKLEGFRLNTQYGFSQRGDNVEPAVNFAVGHSFADDKLHVIAGVDWSRNNGVGSQYNRGWGKLEPGVVGLSANRPAGTPANLLVNYAEWSTMTAGGVINSGPLKGTAFGPGGSTYQFVYGSPLGANTMVGGPLNPNYGLTSTSQQRLLNPTERLSTLARVNYEFTPDTTVTVEGSYARNQVNTNSSFSIRTSEATIGDIPILATNPYLPAAIASQIATTGSTITVGGVPTPGFSLGRLNTDLGQWGAIVTNNVYRGVVDLKSKFWHDWLVDAYFQYGETDQDNNLFPANTARFYQAAYAVRDPVTGAIVCGPLATNPYFLAKSPAARATLTANVAVGGGGSCVPLNPFGPGNNSAATAYIRQNYKQLVVTKQLVGSATVSGSPFSTWAGPVSLAFGGEWRRDSSNQNGDQVSLNGGYYEFNATPLNGSSDVYEGFAEVGVPLAKDMAFAKSLAFDGAVRQTHYQYSGWVTTWNARGVWEPNDWLRLRVSESRDIKAPTVANLFSQGGGALWPVSVRLADGSVVATSVQGATNGSTSVLPEVATTFTGGFVVSPKWSFLNRLRFSADYFDISVNGTIGSLTPPTVLQRYYAGQTQYAQFITFDPTALGGIGKITGTTTNLNRLKENGADFALDYRVPLDNFKVPGQLSVNVLLTWVNQLSTFSTVGGVTTESNRVAGDVYGSQGGPVPRYRSTVTFDYTLGKFGATLQARGFSGFMFGTNFIGPGQAGYNPALSNSINDNSAPGLMYWNLQLRYNVLEGKQRLQVYGTVDNMFDKDPPPAAIVMTQGGGIPYDLIGRTFRVGARMQF
ncbi:MAG: TonB-dependent receptor domain-containing protein [Caulobacteraceae bacterium]